MYEEKIIWHEVVARLPTEEENEEFQRFYDKPLCFVFDCPMPESGQEILIATHSGVDKDICYIGDGTWLEGHVDWEDVLAWADVPKYKGGEEHGET